MNVRPTPLAAAIASLLACSLLAACGGGGGGGMVRSSPPPATPTSPPPPAAAPVGACPTPITGDCVVTGSQVQYLPGGRQSSHALVVGNETAAGHLDLLLGDDSRFDAGVSILNGSLGMSGGSVRNGVDPQTVDGTILDADVTVGERGTFSIGSGGRTHGGILKGNVTNRGQFQLYGTVDGSLENRGSAVLRGSVAGNVSNHGSAAFSSMVKGNWSNDGRLDVGDVLNGVTPNRIDGDFRQSAAGLLSILLPTQAPDWADAYTSTLFVGGRADLGGSLELRRAWFNDGGAWHGYLIAPLPTAPTSIRILHAAGGIFGQFTAWKAANWLDENNAPRPLFITGSLRYGANDVWFDLTRVSIEAAMAAQGASGITLASAGNLDRALAAADRLVGVSSTPLNRVQQGFLHSAGRLLWSSDPKHAQRSLDSLSGSVHVDALHRAGQRDAMSSALGHRLMRLQPGQVSGSWSQAGADGTVAGVDQWLGSRLVLGASTSMGNNTEAGGQARDHQRQAALYLRWFGDGGWYAGGSAGFAHHALTIDRPIDLGAGGRRNAHSQRGISAASLESEAGRRFSLVGGVFAPYASVRAQAIHSERALEQGTSGFELALQATTQARLSAGLGLRYGKRWQFGEGGWLQLDADARMQHALAQAGSPLHAAFIGVPDVGFALPASIGTTTGWMSLGLRGGTAAGWGWSLGHAGSFVGTRPDRQWALGLQRRF